MEITATLSRFVEAQEEVYKQALAEIKRGRKISHWMWFVFPQIQGLGLSETAKFYAIQDTAEAMRYILHPVLGTRLVEISTELLHLRTTDAVEIVGSIDSLKLHSSMTLFALLENQHPVFQQVLDRFFAGKKDQKTVALITQR